MNTGSDSQHLGPDQDTTDVRPFADDRPDEIRVKGVLPNVADEVDGPAHAQRLDGGEEGAAADFNDMVYTAVVRLYKMNSVVVSISGWCRSRERRAYDLEHLVGPRLVRLVIDNVLRTQIACGL